jgi:hypothetical protein
VGAVAAPGVSWGGICGDVNRTAAKVVTAVGAGGVGVSTLLSIAPLATVPHSSGALILTGAGGYVANTLGVAATGWAVATAPVTFAVGGAAVAAGAGTLAYCHFFAPGTPGAGGAPPASGKG